MNTVGAFAAKTHLGQLLSRVELGHESITIERRGRPIAMLVPVAVDTEYNHDQATENILVALRVLRKQMKPLRPGQIKKWVAEGRKR